MSSSRRQHPWGSSAARRSSRVAGRSRPSLEHLESRDLLSVTAANDLFQTKENTALIVPAGTTQVTQTGDGEVTLPAAAGSEFSGTSLPASWQVYDWPNQGGSATVSNHQLIVDGARVGTQALYGPGRSLEFVGTFSGDAFQNIGFGTDFTSGPWAIFSTGNGAGGLYARTNDGTTAHDTLLPGNWLGKSHDFRIDWSTTGVTYSIDGKQVASDSLAINTSMRPLVNDFTGGGGSVMVSSLSLVPPGYAVNFSQASALPADWSTTSASAITVGGGELTVDGALAGPEAVFSPGRSLEFEATFSGDPNQHIGFGTDVTYAPWAIFSTKNGGALYARTNNGTSSNDTLLPGNWLGTPHDFRIDWTDTGVTYSIDGTQVAFDSIAITSNMRPVVSDFQPGAGAVSVDWLRMTPYSASGTFFSRVFDAGSRVAWGSASWTDTTPAGTSLALSVRLGNTPIPDSTWTDFMPLSASGAAITGTSRYLQYRADLATTDSSQTPALDSFTVSTFTDTTVADFSAGTLGTGILANDSDGSGDPLTAVLVSGPADGGLTLNPDGSFTYSPPLNFTGTDSFSYEAVAPDGTLSNPATVSINVVPLTSPTTTTVTSDHPSGSVYGQGVSFTATVSASNSALGTPTGSVEFYDGSTDLGAGTETGNSAAWTLTTSALTAGSHPITAVFTPDSQYFLGSDNSTTPLTFAVSQAPLTISADSKSMVYGGTLPALTASYSGFVNGDTAASLTTAPTLSTTATASSHVAGNPYSITASGAADADYTINYVGGTLTVTPAALTISANSKSMVYGSTQPALTATYTGLVNGDTPAAITGLQLSTAPATSHVGSYAINASGAADSDYTIGYKAGTLTVTPAPLTITANNQSKVYGAALPTLTASYSGFVNGDTAASLTTAPTLSTTATASSHVAGNPYAINVSGAADSDYTISYKAGSLTVTPAPLTITANNQTKTYGAALPTLTASYSGLVNGDTAASLTTAPTLSTTATASSHVAGNPYSITASGAADPDYTIKYVAGTLTITPAPLTITANNTSRLFGTPNPPFSAAYSGFVNGDTPGSLGGVLTFSTPATIGSLVGTYPITPAGLTSSDYTISFVNGTLSVTVSGGVYVLNPTASGALSLSGNANLNFAGLVEVDSSSSGALSVSGNARLTASSIRVVGGYVTAGNASVSATPLTGVPQTGDPLAGLAAPSLGGTPQSVNLSGNASLTIKPGVYSQIKVAGNASLIMQPGIYGPVSGELGGPNATPSNVSGDETASTLPAPLGGNELARIQDAVTGLDTLLTPYNVTITEVAAPDNGLANLVLDAASASALGGVADGVLGTYTSSTGEITLVQGWNWYAGADPSAVGSDQYDFQTVVTHELGHALGLGHSPDPNSVMYATLATGTTRRVMTAQDLNVPDADSGPDGLHIAGMGDGALPGPVSGELGGPNATPKVWRKEVIRCSSRTATSCSTAWSARTSWPTFCTLPR